MPSGNDGSARAGTMRVTANAGTIPRTASLRILPSRPMPLKEPNPMMGAHLVEQAQLVLFALPGWLAFLGKGVEALFRVRGFEQAEDAAPFQCEGTLQRHLQSLLRRQLDLTDRHRRAA